MDVAITPRKSKNGKKTYYTFEWGKGPGERQGSGIYTFTKPKSQAEKIHNTKVLDLLTVKKSELVLELQSAGSAYSVKLKVKENFLTFYTEYAIKNKKANNRHLDGSLTHFKDFINKDYIPAVAITEELCKGYRTYLLSKFNGDTPANYFRHFKQAIKAAKKAGYFHENPCMELKSKTNPSRFIKETLEVEDYLVLLNTAFYHTDVREAFILCCYTGLRGCDVKRLAWDQIFGKSLNTRVIQGKTGKELVISLHPIAKAILEARRARLKECKPTDKVFSLPTSTNGCNDLLGEWVKLAGIQKHITWHCARHSFSILLQDARVDAATVALLLGQSSTQYVDRVYKRHRPKNMEETLSHLPQPGKQSGYFNTCYAVSFEVLPILSYKQSAS